MIGDGIRDYRVPDFHELTPKIEIQSRIDCAREKVVEQGLDALLVVYPIDLFYFSGLGIDDLVLIGNGSLRRLSRIFNDFAVLCGQIDIAVLRLLEQRPGKDQQDDDDERGYDQLRFTAHGIRP